MSRTSKQIIDLVISTAGGWAEAPGLEAVVELENKIDVILESICNQTADDPTQWNPEVLQRFIYPRED